MQPDRCRECGFDFAGDRARLAVRCVSYPGVLADLLKSADGRVVQRRPGAEVWSAIEYAAHVGEAVCWYIGRIRRVLKEDLPQLAPFDFDAAAEGGDYHRRSIDEVVADLRTACRALADLAPLGERQPVESLRLEQRRIATQRGAALNPRRTRARASRARLASRSWTRADAVS